MSKVTETLGFFGNLVLAKLTGDNNQVTALRIEKKAKAAVRSQIAAAESAISDLEIAKENAEEALEEAQVPTEMISSNENYIGKIISAQSRLDTATEKLEDAKTTLAYWNEMLETKFKS